VSISDFTPQSLLFKVIAWLIVIGVVVGALVYTADHFEKVGYDRRVAEDQVNINKALIEAAKKTQELQTKLTEANDARTKAEQTLLNTVNANRALVGGLRKQLDTYNADLSNQPPSALVARIDTLSDVLGECSSRYTEVAAKADGHAADALMLQKAWPTN